VRLPFLPPALWKRKKKKLCRQWKPLPTLIKEKA
jgi:hypothetical protein